MKFNYSTRIKIRFRDLDAFGHVNNVVYLTYFEEARVAYCKQLGIFVELTKSPISFIILDNYCKYEVPLRVLEAIDVFVRIAELKSKSFQFQYKIVLADSERIVATGYSTAVAYDYSKRQTIPIPDEVRKKIKDFEGI